MTELFQISAGLIAILTFLGGIVAWLINYSRQQYGLQRDFDHLKRSYQQLVEAQNSLLREFDRRSDHLESQLRELKAFLIVNLAKRDSSSTKSEISDF